MPTQDEPKAPPRVALITGATDGIGKATARSLLRRGFEVVITGRSEARCQATVEALTKSVAGARVSSLVADLSDLTAVRALADAFLGRHDRLDLLLLNANAITQTFVRTKDGFEANFALGYLGRALLSLRLRDVLAKTAGAHVLTVVGLNLDRIDFDDPVPEKGFRSMRALGRWQWAMQVFAREWNRVVPTVPMNVFMPGLVRTKILSDEPQPMRLVVKLANLIMGIAVERSGEEVADVVEQIERDSLRDVYFARAKKKPPRKLGDEPGDGARLFTLTERLLSPWNG